MLPYFSHPSMRSLLPLLLALTACRPGPDAPGAGAPAVADSIARDIRIARGAPAALATAEYGLTARVPRGSYYCAISSDWVGPDHGRVLYLRPPAACDSAGYGVAASPEPLPLLSLSYAYNVAEGDFGDRSGERPGRTDAEIAGAYCVRPQALAGVTLLGRPAVGCRQLSSDTVEVTAIAGYFLNRSPADPGDVPDAQVTVTLRTTRARIATEWPIFVAFTGSVAQCAAEWRSDQPGDTTTFWVGAAPGRPECPDSF